MLNSIHVTPYSWYATHSMLCLAHWSMCINMCSACDYYYVLYSLPDHLYTRLQYGYYGALFPIPPFMASPLRRGSKRPKQSGEGVASQSKKHKAGTMCNSSHSSTNATHPHHSGRAGARMGGHMAQLEWIGAQLKASQHVSRPLMTFPNDAAENPVTPPLRKGWNKVTCIYVVLA